MCASAAGCAVNQVSSIRVEQRDPLVEIGREEIDVSGSRYMYRLELGWGANVEDDHLLVSNQLLRLVGVHVLYDPGGAVGTFRSPATQD